MIRKGSNQAGGSALTGDWKPMEAAAQPEPTPPAPTPAPQPEPAVSRSVEMHASITCGILRQLACVHVPVALYSICATLAASVNLHCGATCTGCTKLMLSSGVSLSVQQWEHRANR